MFEFIPEGKKRKKSETQHVFVEFRQVVIL